MERSHPKILSLRIREWTTRPDLKSFLCVSAGSKKMQLNNPYLANTTGNRLHIGPQEGARRRSHTGSTRHRRSGGNLSMCYGFQFTRTASRSAPFTLTEAQATMGCSSSEENSTNAANYYRVTSRLYITAATIPPNFQDPALPHTRRAGADRDPAIRPYQTESTTHARCSAPLHRHAARRRSS